MHELLSVGVVILLGILGGKLSHRIKIPRVTGYMLVGLIFGPSVMGLITSATLQNIQLINEIALGLILFAIGGRLAAKKFGAHKAVVDQLGLTLLPQAGVAIGMFMTVAENYPEMGKTLGTVILSSVLIYEGVGPFLTRLALARAREIRLQE